MLEDAAKRRDVMISALLTKVIEIASVGNGTYETNLVSNCYAMQSAVKAHLMGETAEIDENIANQFVIDDDDDDDGNGGQTV